MHRSSSAPRVSEDAFSYSSVSSSDPISNSRSRSLRPSFSDTELPTFDPHSRVGQRERLRHQTAANAVHFIPLLLIFCAVILWIFSYPG